MKILTMLVLASVLGLSSAVARADSRTAPKTRPQPTAKTQAATTAVRPGRGFAAGQDAHSAAKQATGKKGAERKAFMKTCLSDQRVSR